MILEEPKEKKKTTAYSNKSIVSVQVSVCQLGTWDVLDEDAIGSRFKSPMTKSSPVVDDRRSILKNNSILTNQALEDIGLIACSGVIASCFLCKRIIVIGWHGIRVIELLR
jgi:hypothetical protein